MEGNEKKFLKITQSEEVHSFIIAENVIGKFGRVQRLEELESSLQFFGSWMFEG